jgi:hypothetical protein
MPEPSRRLLASAVGWKATAEADNRELDRSLPVVPHSPRWLMSKPTVADMQAQG